uniref:Glycosyltransferase N-terminal domain-containing protein n=1 Tax=Triticum urartu TaxID=4572 RepID=A0A8R7P985_TRIUA
MATNQKKPHAVLVPFPAQGHVTPMMKLAKVLHRKGFHITFVNTEYNQRRLVRSRGPGAVAGLPGFRFATIPDGIPTSDADADATQDPPSLCYYTMTTCLPHLKNLLRDLNGVVGAPPVSCVVGDGVMSFCVDAAAELGVPCTLFWTASACGFMGYRNFWFLLDEGLTPLKDEEQVKNGYLDTPVTQACGMSKHMRLRDFSSFVRTTDRRDILFNFLLHEVEQSDRATAIILNTFDELEQTALDAMRTILPLPVYTIGPLNSLTDQLVSEGDSSGTLGAIRSSLWREDQSCLEWLQGREPRSVVYVNYGSVTTMSK